MRLFNFFGKDLEWESFKESPFVRYGKHSFYIGDPSFISRNSDFTAPYGYGIKVFKTHSWQDTSITDGAIIQNIFWMNGLAPRVKEIMMVNFGFEDIHKVYLVEHLEGKRIKNIDGLEKIAKENFIEINYGGSNLELQNDANWIEGKYLDFGGFKFKKDLYKNKLIKKINKVTHFGHLVGGKHISYQSIEDYHVPGKRKTKYRIDTMQLQKISFRNKSVIDIGCNLGIMMHYAKSRGASKLTGYDLPELIEVAQEYANLRGEFDFNFVGTNLKIDSPKERADIVFYLAMSDYLGFPEWLWDITGELCLYEGHAHTNQSDAENRLKRLFPIVEPLGFTKDRDTRPIFVCYKNN